LGSASQGLSRKQFEAIQPDFGRMHAASTDGAVFAVALTVQADEEGASICTNMQYSMHSSQDITACRVTPRTSKPLLSMAAMTALADNAVC